MKGALRTFRAILNNINNSHDIQSHFSSFSQQMINLASKGVTQLIQSLNASSANSVPNGDMDKHAEEALEILQEWAHTIATILENYDLQCPRHIQQFSEIP